MSRKGTDEASGTLGAPSASWRARRVDDDRGMNLDGPKTNNMLRNFKTISLIKCRPVQNLSSKSKIMLGVKFCLPLKKKIR
jgi:hypothetical protein